MEKSLNTILKKKFKNGISEFSFEYGISCEMMYSQNYQKRFIDMFCRK